MFNFLFTSTPLKFLVQSLWRDEAFAYLIAKSNFLEILSLTARDFTPPLHYFLLNVWMRIFGSSEIALRSLSLIFFWATLYMAFLFIHNVLKVGRLQSFAYTLLFLINPFLNYYAFEARAYTLFAFLATLSFYLFFKKNYKYCALVNLIGLYTHYFMIFVIITEISHALLTRKDTELKKLVRSNAISFLFFIPWILYVLRIHPFLDESFWIIKPAYEEFKYLPSTIYLGYKDVLKFYKKLLPIFSFFIYLFFLVFLFKARSSKIKNRDFLLLIALWSFLAPLLAYLISFFKPIFLPRYFIFSSVGIVLLVIYMLESFKNYFKIFFLVVLLIFTLGYNKMQIKERGKRDIRKTITEIKSLASKDDLLYVTSELNFHTAQYYFDKERVFIYGKTYEQIPSYVGKIIIPKKSVTNLYPKYPQKAFVLRDDLSYDILAIF